MGGDIQTIDRRTARAMLQWWLESGVDTAIAEEPRRWLASAAPAPAPVAMTAGPAPATEMPREFTEFRAWLETGSGLPLDRPGARRLLPYGQEGAEIMILADMPSDGEGAQPIEGDAWVLTVRMLSAIGFTADQAYVASIACFAAPGAKLDGPDLERCAEIARHHVALVKPRRLLLLGEATVKALTGDSLVKARGRVLKVEGVRSVATMHPKSLLSSPEMKSRAWRDLLLLMEEDR